MAEAQVSKIFSQEELLVKVDDLEKRLQTKDAEIQVYKMLMSQMEEEVAQAKKYKALHEKQTQDVDGLRTESEKTLTKAKSMIFEKTKIIKNQELQIEAFTQQIESLREVVRITKDLLEIRNMEVHQLETKIAAIDGKQKAERERYELMHKKLELMIRHNADLKREYETQLCLFTALRERYSERELAKDVIDNFKNEKSLVINGLENTTVIKTEPIQPTPISNDVEAAKANILDQNAKTAEQSLVKTETVNTAVVVPSDPQVTTASNNTPNSEQNIVKIDPVQQTNEEQIEAGKASTSEQNVKTVDPSPATFDKTNANNETNVPKDNVADAKSNSEQSPVKAEDPVPLNTSTTITTETVIQTDDPVPAAANLASEPATKTENPLPTAEAAISIPACSSSEQGEAVSKSIETVVENKE